MTRDLWSKGFLRIFLDSGFALGCVQDVGLRAFSNFFFFFDSGFVWGCAQGVDEDWRISEDLFQLIICFRMCFPAYHRCLEWSRPVSLRKESGHFTL